MTLLAARPRLIAALIAVVGSLAAALPATADAATVSKSGATVTVTGASGEANKLFISRTPSAFSVTDSGATLAAGSGCNKAGDKVNCSATGVTDLSVSPGDLGDTVTNFTFTPATIDGGDGNDTLTGGGSVDTVAGGAGDDTVYTRDFAADTVNCGGGADRVSSDSRDGIALDCETVNDQPFGGGTGGAGGGTGGTGGTGGEIAADDPTAPELILPTKPVIEVSPDGIVPLEIACPAISTVQCEGEIVIYLDAARRAAAPLAGSARRRGRVVVGRARFSVAPGQLATVKARLTRRGRKIVRKSKRARVSVRVSRRGGGTAKSKKVTLKPKRKKKRR